MGVVGVIGVLGVIRILGVIGVLDIIRGFSAIGEWAKRACPRGAGLCRESRASTVPNDDNSAQGTDFDTNANVLTVRGVLLNSFPCR